MKIGELSKKTGTTVETIRFYEREGLLPEPERTESNYRTYGDSHAQRLLFIRRCRGLDMTLEEVRTLLGFRDRPDQDCSNVNALIDAHIGHVTQRIKELRSLERQLRDLRASCAASNLAQNCGILNELSTQSNDDGNSVPSPHMHVHGAHH